MQDNSKDRLSGERDYRKDFILAGKRNSKYSLICIDRSKTGMIIGKDGDYISVVFPNGTETTLMEGHDHYQEANPGQKRRFYNQTKFELLLEALDFD